MENIKTILASLFIIALLMAVVALFIEDTNSEPSNKIKIEKDSTKGVIKIPINETGHPSDALYKIKIDDSTNVLLYQSSYGVALLKLN
jgi:hypothetical protein